MRQTNEKMNRSRRATLRAIKSEPAAETQISKLVNTAWNFAYSALWNCNQFSSREITASKEKIEEYCCWLKTPKEHSWYSVSGYCWQDNM